MIGTMLTAEEWSAKLNTTHGKEIFDAVRLFYERPLELKSPRAGLEKRIREAFSGFGVEIQEVAPVSFSAIMMPVADLHKEIGKFVYARIVDGLKCSLTSELDEIVPTPGKWPEIPRSEISELLDRSIRLVSDLVVRPHTAHLTEKYGVCFDPRWAQMPFDLLHCLLTQVLELAFGRREAAARAGAFCTLFLDGNFPLGLIRRREMKLAVVLVA